jgi:hypothetical protein
MPLTTVRSTLYTTAVPTGWEIHLPAGNLLEAYDPVAPTRKHLSSLEFFVQPGPGTCAGEKVKTTTDDACVVVRYDRAAKVPLSVVEMQTSKHFLRITHSVTEGEKPAESAELKELALRILNQSGPPAKPVILSPPVASPSPTTSGGTKTAATH